ncbi:hypothetical protein CC78DRAFT_338241 [Lojkania enalia]|uniref:Uncharacterized protein n=1 Tax=Lojkania enalia TaxID=147567 RepID=A0A9P4K5U6_9PLEO|nr:hypothetical protein CC78DRAFT_338241 [Didymosphaeria enalia]
MKEVRTKLKYPFQRDDLLFLKGMVEHVQQNLHTALLALVIDEQHRNSSDLKTQMSDFEQNVGHGFTGVHAHVSAIGSLIQPMQARMNIIEEGVSGLRDNYGKISKVIEPVNVRVAGIEDGLAGIQTDVSALSSAIQPITSMPNTLSTLTDTVQSKSRSSPATPPPKPSNKALTTSNK